MTAATRSSRIAETFERLRSQQETAIIPYLTVGFPERDSAQRIVPELVRNGAALVELGIPFSDPLADGATIQHSSFVALQNGIDLVYCLDVVRNLRSQDVDVPLIFMGYFNPILRFGLERFASSCAEAGVDGVIVPDLPVEESDELLDACKQFGRDVIFMLAPTSTDELIAKVAERASGFIYCVSLAGVTGVRDQLPADVDAFLARVRSHTDLPLALGFGISRAEHVAQVSTMADAAVVGSALISRLDSAKPGMAAEAAGEFMRELLSYRT